MVSGESWTTGKSRFSAPRFRLSSEEGAGHLISRPVNASALGKQHQQMRHVALAGATELQVAVRKEGRDRVRVGQGVALFRACWTSERERGVKGGEVRRRRPPQPSALDISSHCTPQGLVCDAPPRPFSGEAMLVRGRVPASAWPLHGGLADPERALVPCSTTLTHPPFPN